MKTDSSNHCSFLSNEDRRLISRPRLAWSSFSFEMIMKLSLRNICQTMKMWFFLSVGGAFSSDGSVGFLRWGLHQILRAVSLPSESGAPLHPLTEFIHRNRSLEASKCGNPERWLRHMSYLYKGSQPSRHQLFSWRVVWHPISSLGTYLDKALITGSPCSVPFLRFCIFVQTISRIEKTVCWGKGNFSVGHGCTPPRHFQAPLCFHTVDGIPSRVAVLSGFSIVPETKDFWFRDTGGGQQNTHPALRAK